MRVTEAAKCPTCKAVGELILSQRAVSPKYKVTVDVAVYDCAKELCLQRGKRWLVESDLNGEVIGRDHGPRGTEKDFESRPEASSKGKIYLEEQLGEEIE